MGRNMQRRLHDECHVVISGEKTTYAAIAMWKSVMFFSSLELILGECPIIHSPPATFLFVCLNGD